ncbi:MAG: rhodanese-like domain-containing protein [Balneola sp.]
MKIKNPLFARLLDKLLAHSVSEISIADAFNRKEEFIFLDAREFEEFYVSHVQKAIHVGYKSFDTERLNKIDRSQPLIVYCSIGYRSEKIAAKLSNLGFKNVQNLYGGIFEWYNQEFDVVNSSGITSEIHPYNAAWGVWISGKE